MSARVTGVVRANLAAAGDDTLAQLRDFFARVASEGTEAGQRVASEYLAAIDDEIDLRKREP